MTSVSRRAFLASAGAVAAVAGLPAGASVPVAPIAKAVKPPLPTWIVGTPGEWDHEIIRAATREAAVLLRCDECEGEDDEDFAGPDGCECEPCLARGNYEATRVTQWDGRPEASIGSGDWLDIGSEAICSRCDYETAKEMCGHNVAGKAVCEDCMTLADWDIVDPEHAAELRAEMAEDEAST
ncbi:hypothetical protein LOK46_10820 [Methylobacterium sp. NMS14P]|uniref:hypothetical protein n=1 Tax=Methylobacterium sp. NMS14P TaxID=2894310 RepID=UPI002359DCC9|nr:hypothetical protein [Methylobacterium sp. NMS14P]WCS27282.1 hypothetical protein LOK46_10820 [Methylobacterium sp. NMS14P]